MANNEEQTGNHTTKNTNILKKCSNIIVHTLEAGFYRLGLFIGKWPWLVIGLSLLFVAIWFPGLLLYFYEENRASELWVSSGSQAVDDLRFVDEYFPSRVRFSSLLLEDTNVLTPEAVQAMVDIDEAVKNISGDGYHWENICARLGSECWSNSLLELWSFNYTLIRSLSQQDILDMVNSDISISPVYGSEFNITSILSTFTYDGSGDISGAGAALMTYVINYNVTVVGGDEVDLTADAWELDFLELAEAGNAGIDTIYYYAYRSFGDVGGGAIGDDLNFLIVGYIVVIAFVSAVLGNFNCVEHRIYVTLGGIMCIGLSIVVSFGLCSYAGLFYGPLHSILPFLLLGIGVDDMFVLVQSYDNLPEHTRSLPVHERIAQAVRHAGVSITVTSVTDVLAFGVGASTILPALQSFCLYCCVGILATFLLQATFFVACLAINEKRASSERNACCCCYKHVDYTPNKCSQTPLIPAFFEKYFARFLLKLPTKIGIVVLTLALFGVNMYGLLNLKQEFDNAWFLPTNSYARQYLDTKDAYFPSDDVDTYVYLGGLDYYGNFSQLESLYNNIVDDPYILSVSVDCWYMNFKYWLAASTDASVTSLLDGNDFPTTEANFYSLVQVYINSPPYDGIRFARDMVFDGNDILASRIAMSHTNTYDSSSEIAAMDSLRDVTAASGFPEFECFPYAFEYLDFETNKVIQTELFRNLGLAFLCVFVMTLLLIADIWCCILVALSVLLTLVDVLGTISFWGLTIDTVTSINSIVAIGLAVDYSAHIGHNFMTHSGLRNDRARSVLKYMAPAVFYGGFSTFLAFIMLALSSSYVFTTFFKVFFAVVIFGLYHGLVFLPVLLSWLGPAPYDSVDEEDAEMAGAHGRDQKLGENHHSDKDPKAASNGDVKLAAVDKNGMSYTNPALDTSVQDLEPVNQSSEATSSKGNPNRVSPTPS